jgi:glycosyltransferase involved in cell wall biosynthesis
MSRFEQTEARVRWLRWLAWRVVRRIVNDVLTPVLYVTLRLLASRERRRPRAGKPRLFWGTIPMINMKYHSLAMRRLGYESTTVVEAVYTIHARSDFDVLTSELVDRRPLLRRLPRSLRRLLEPYVAFAWALRNFDVFTIYTTGRILRTTPLRYRELQLLQRAGKKVVLLAYGADVQVMSRFRGLPFKHAMCMDYPEYTRHEAETLREMEYCVAHADHVVSGVDWVDHMPRWDSLTAGHFAIDTDEWTPAPEPADRDPNKPIVVFHAPNHRELKGTRFLIDACAELEAEGEPIELQLVEKVPNSEIRRRLAEADVVADQFIVGWYALFAIEAMAMAKPVLCFLRPDLLELYTLYSFGGECPLVNTPALEIKDRLRELVHDAVRRRELGVAGRRYVENHHSLEAVGEILDGIYRTVWPIEPLEHRADAVEQ